MKNNKALRLVQTECGAAATFPAHQGRAPSRQESPQRSPTRASCAALVNALFWKILVTRVKSFFAARPGAASPPFRVPGAAQREYNESHGPVARFAISGLMMLPLPWGEGWGEGLKSIFP